MVAATVIIPVTIIARHIAALITVIIAEPIITVVDVTVVISPGIRET